MLLNMRSWVIIILIKPMVHRPFFNQRPFPTDMRCGRIWKVLPNLRCPIPVNKTQVSIAHETLPKRVNAVKLVHSL
jgi:hypothetical protein